jgi:preprotein translocase subunit YajC
MNPADLLFFAIIAAFLLFIIYSNRKRKEVAQKLANSVVIGARVVMLGGITGKVSSITDETIIVESSPGTKIEFVKGAVRSVVEAPEVEAPAAKKKTKASQKTQK